MDGSNLIYVVMPIVMVLALVVLVGLPFVGTRGAGDSRSGGGHSRGQESGAQLPDRSVAADAVESSGPTSGTSSMP
jgi:hypothetical protein